MPYSIERKSVSAARIVGVRHRVTFGETDLGTLIGEAYAQVYTALPPGPWPGHNVILYEPDGDTTARVLIGRHFDGDLPEGLEEATLPATDVLWTEHFGEYGELHRAHKAIIDQLASEGHNSVGPNWEIYGDWHDEPAQRRTEVLYSLG